MQYGYTIHIEGGKGIKATTSQSSEFEDVEKLLPSTCNVYTEQVEEFLETVKRSGASYVQVDSFF